MISLEKLSIVVVDDVKTMRSIVRKMLKNLKIGSVVHTAENGVEALRILNSNRIDLAIIDWKMPVMDGATLLENIRNDRIIRDMPVLVISGESELDVVLEAAEIEVDGYLIKPLTPALLEKTIAGIMTRAKNPEKADLHIRKARDLEENQEYKKAIEHLKHAVQLRPNASRLLRKLGLLYQNIGDEATMEKCFHKAVQINSKDVVTRYLLAMHHWKNKDLLSSSEYFLEVMSMTRKFCDDAVRLGEELLEKSANRLAINLFTKTIHIMDNDFATRERIIDICIEDNKELEYAKSLLKTAVHDYPSNMDLTFKSGLVHEMLGDMDKALEYYFLTERVQGSRIDVKLKIARILLDKNKVIKADEYVRQVLAKDPENQEAQMLRQRI